MMKNRGKYTVNRGSSSSSEPPSSSLGLVGIGSGSENNATSAPSGSGSQGGSTLDSSSNLPSFATYHVPSSVDVLGSALSPSYEHFVTYPIRC
ncbi:hypothetical protein J1N35_010363 [Gossypium stocksii]|uniref:Uncharacterized protein n=1 Tax=Gossypium stocksii TaxID=47602 RepID=A0A9D3W236_9ROSI|nr:hypothetical protein J1N35_010363 [Gossypium stocksii]